MSFCASKLKSFISNEISMPIIFLPRFFDLSNPKNWKAAPRFHESDHLACYCRPDIWSYEENVKDCKVLLATEIYNTLAQKYLIGYFTVKDYKSAIVGEGDECKSCRELLKLIMDKEKCRAEKVLGKYLKLYIDEIYFLDEPIIINPTLNSEIFGNKTKYKNETYSWEMLYEKSEKQSYYWNAVRLSFFRFKYKVQKEAQVQERLAKILDEIKSKSLIRVTPTQCMKALKELFDVCKCKNIIQKIKNCYLNNSESLKIANLKFHVAKIPEYIVQELIS